MNKKIKVLNIITRLIVGGAQETMAFTATHMDRNRFDVHVLSGLSNDPGGGELVTGIRRDGIEVVEIPELTTPLKPLKDVIAFTKIYRFLKENQFDIIHTHGSKAGVLGRIAAGYANVPLVVHTVHGWSFNDRMSPLRKRIFISMERLAARYTDSFIVVTKFDIHKGLKEKVGKEHKFSVIHGGVELNKFKGLQVDINEKKKSLGIEPEMNVVCMIGRLSEQKSPEDFIRVASKVVKARPNTAFLLIGGGPLLSKILAMIKDLKLEKNVIATGFYPGDIYEIIPIIDIFMLTSLWEGLPKVFPMSMAAGKPIVATRVDGAPEAIEDNVTGFLTAPKDVETLAEKALYLLQNPTIAQKMGAKARERVYPDFCIHEMVHRIEDLYISQLAKKGKNYC